jgi:sulfite exporter TauE/SafE
MLDYLLVQGSVLLPTGLVLLVLGFEISDNKVASWGFMILGCLAIILGLWYMSKAWKKAMAKEREDKQNFNRLIEEIRALGNKLEKVAENDTKHKRTNRL